MSFAPIYFEFFRMNILLTSAGRRNYLVEFFQQALGEQGKVFAADARSDAAALRAADKSFLLPLVDDHHYLEKLMNLCQKHDVHLLIALNDLELPILAKHRTQFLQIGTRVVISAPEIVELCFDKWLTFQCLNRLNLQTPKTYLSISESMVALDRKEIRFPVVIKPRWGSASIGIEYPEDRDELELAYSCLKKRLMRTILAQASSCDIEQCILIQEYLRGSEYGLDIINDLEGNYVTTFAKRKLAMRCGETDRAVTVQNESLSQLGQLIGYNIAHVGNLDCDVMETEHGYNILEMNPRFGGGYPFSHMGGANIPAALIAWARGEKVDPSWLQIQPNIAAAKFDRLVKWELVS
jgi:carbamoyl-phosphate synthase large subunit